MVPVHAFCLWPTLEDVPKPPLTPDRPRLSWPVWAILRQTWGTDSNHHIESIHLFIKSAATAVDFHACAPLSFLSLFGPVHSFFNRPLPPFEPIRPPAGLHLHTRSLCRVILAGASCKSFLESQLHLGKAQSWRRVAETLSRDLDPFPKPPTTRDSIARRHLPLLLAAFTTRPESHRAVQLNGNCYGLGFFCGLRHALSSRQLVGELQERCHKSPQG